MQIVDIARVSAWRATPLVSKWWDGEIDADDLADPISRQWIVSHQDQPFAFLQDYDPHAEPDHPFAFLPPASRGLDQFIGDPDMLGLGHGPAFVDLFVAALFAGGAPAVAWTRTRTTHAPSAPTRRPAFRPASVETRPGAAACS